MLNFFIGLLIAGVGTVLIIFAGQLNKLFYFSWRRLGVRGYQILGVLIILLSAFVIFGFIDITNTDPSKV